LGAVIEPFVKEPTKLEAADVLQAGSLSIAYLLGYALLMAGDKITRASQIKSAKLREEIEKRAKIKSLAFAFVSSEFPGWLNTVSSNAATEAMRHAHAVPESQFALYSHDPLQFPGPATMPHSILGLALIFSNGYVSVISNIFWNIFKTTCTLVEHDNPVFEVSPAQDWNVEEFHYQDVVEIKYNPRSYPPVSGKSISLDGIRGKLAQNDASNAPDEQLPVEGYLVLSLVNGEKKEYPAAKNTVTNFVQLAREKVRAAKTK